MIAYIRNPEDSTERLLELMSVKDTKIILKEPIKFLYTINKQLEIKIKNLR